MKFSLSTAMIFLTWSCLVVGTLSTDSGLLRGLCNLMIFSSLLFAFAMIFTTTSENSRAFCIGYCSISFGLILLHHFSVLENSYFTHEVTELFVGNSSDWSERGYLENMRLITLFVAQTLGGIGGCLLSWIVSRTNAESSFVGQDGGE